MKKVNWFQRILLKLAGVIINKNNVIPLNYGNRVMVNNEIFVITQSQLTKDIQEGTTFKMSAQSEYDYILKTKVFTKNYCK